MRLNEIRKQKGLTQTECAAYLGIPLRTYQGYESCEEKCPGIKHQFILEKLNEYGFIDEAHGILTKDSIKATCESILAAYNISYCYLFGSYAKGKATEQSDVDLLISGEVTGLDFFALTESLREGLKKRVDLLDIKQLHNNPDLINEILKDGIKIYG